MDFGAEIETAIVKGLGLLLGFFAIVCLAGALLTAWGVAHHAMRIVSGCPYDDERPDRPWRQESCSAAVIQTIAMAFCWMGLVVLSGGRQLGFDYELSLGMASTWLSAGGVMTVWATTYVYRSWKRGRLAEAVWGLDRPAWLTFQFFLFSSFGLLSGVTGVGLFLG